MIPSLRPVPWLPVLLQQQQSLLLWGLLIGSAGQQLLYALAEGLEVSHKKHNHYPQHSQAPSAQHLLEVLGVLRCILRPRCLLPLRPMLADRLPVHPEWLL